jgi:hypothetical protein
MSLLAAITPSEVLHLWHAQSSRHCHEHSRLIAFSHALVRHLQDCSPSDEERTPLSDLNLPTGVHNALRRGGFSYIDEIDGLSPDELLMVNHVGAASVCCIHEALANWRRCQRDRQTTQPIETPASEPAPVDAEHLKALVGAFYAPSSDRERMAALLLRAADLVATGGPDRLRALSMGLLSDVLWAEAEAKA